METALLALAGSGTAFATGLGALPVSRLGVRASTIRPGLWGMTVGLMTVASIVGLLLPALHEGSTAPGAVGLAAGIAFLLVSRRSLKMRDVHVGQLSGAGVRRSVLVFGVLLVHSLPEGFAIGTAFASETQGLGLFVILAIALQNVPEGTSVAIPMEAAGFRPRQQFCRPDERAATGRRAHGIRARARDRKPAADLVRVRRRSDAFSRRRRARPGNLSGGAPWACRSPARPWARF